MNAVIATNPDDAPPPVEHEGVIFGVLLMLTRTRTQSASTSHAAAILLAYVLRSWPARKGWVNGSRRRIAKAVRLTEWQVRVAFDQLVKSGWIERRQTVDHVSVHYRLTPAFAEAAELTGEDVSGIVKQDEATMDEAPDPRVHRFSQHEIIVRLFAANERGRGPRYNRRLLRSVGRCLHAVLAFAGAPVLLSVRGIAKATGMSFRSARRARDRLVAWEVLIDKAGGYRIRYSHLHDILYNAVLPPPNARSPSARSTA